jgi:hypothetical protein
MPLRREWPNVLISHVARVLLTLLKAEREGRTLTVSELIDEAGLYASTFYATLRRALEEGELASFEVDKRERIIYVRLTERGRKLAQCLEEIGIERDLGLGVGEER